MMLTTRSDRGAVIGVVIDSQPSLGGLKIKLVKDQTPKRGERRARLKCPGGHIEECDVDPAGEIATAKKAFIRETLEETGVKLETAMFLFKEVRRSKWGNSYTKYFFWGLGDFSKATKTRGNDGEFIHTFLLNGAIMMPNLLRHHKPLLVTVRNKIVEILGK